VIGTKNLIGASLVTSAASISAALQNSSNNYNTGVYRMDNWRYPALLFMQMVCDIDEHFL